jgi:DNA-binding GntR family transcriptional regulator
VYLQLRREIVDGQMPAGTRLVRRTLSKRLGVSPVPVTEALFRLEQDGLVKSEPMYGARVTPLTVESVRNETVLREALECQAARLFCVNATDEEKAELMKLAEAVDQIISDPKIRPNAVEDDEHLAFHLKIARYSGFPILEAQLKRVWFRRLMQLNNLNARLNPVPRDWHEQLMRVLSNNDPDAAARKMREHVRFHVEELDRLVKQGTPLSPQ